MTDRDSVISFMSSIDNRTPILLLSKAAKIFKSIYGGRVYSINNKDDMDLVRDMSISKLNKAIVIDLSDLYNDEDILKLIEESKLQFILLSYKDNLSDVLMSRCKSTLKIPDININQCNYLDSVTAYNSVVQNELFGDTLNMYLAENCPVLSKYMSDTQFLKYKDRVLNILVNVKENSNG